jgi:opacity protein-like surface antigen
VKRRKDGTTVCAVVLLLSVLPSFRLSAQGVLNQFSYDNLRLSGIQADLGVLGASKLTGAIVGGLRVDYGRIAPHVRLLFGLSYFRAQFDQETRTRFEQRLRSLVIDPSGDDTIRVGRIFWSDLTGDVDFQLVFPQGQKATAYLGAGVGIHLRNGSGRAINGTFVEDALDEISAGLNGTVGVEFHLSPAWRFTLDGRGTLSSGLNTVSVRSGLMYRFRAKQP